MMSQVAAPKPSGFSRVIAKPESNRAVRCQAGQLGDKILPTLRTPLDWALLPGRVALGAALNINQNLEQLPSDLERISTLLTDPRPLEDKQSEVLLEVETRMANFLERSLSVENDIVGQIDSILPEDVKAALPEDLKQVLKPRDMPATFNDYYNDEKPLATWTITSMDEDDNNGQYKVPPMGSSSGMAAVSSNGAGAMPAMSDDAPASTATIATSQAAAELVEIQAAVMAVREHLEGLKTNTDSSKIPMIKLNLREAAQSLGRRLEQGKDVAAASADGTGIAAVEEAQALLVEVQALDMA